jgi:hypothetical protein
VGGLTKAASQVTASNVNGLINMTSKVATGGAASSSSASAENASADNAPPVKDKNSEGFKFYNSLVSTPSTPAASVPAAESSADSSVAPEKELWNYFTGGTGSSSAVEKPSAEVTLPPSLELQDTATVQETASTSTDSVFAGESYVKDEKNLVVDLDTPTVDSPTANDAEVDQATL